MTQATAVAFDQYNQLDDADCNARVDAANQAPQGRMITPGERFQQAHVYKHADPIGESLQRSDLAAQADARYIVFCGANVAAQVTNIVPYMNRIQPLHPERSLERLTGGNVVIIALQAADRIKNPARPALQRRNNVS